MDFSPQRKTQRQSNFLQVSVTYFLYIMQWIDHKMSKCWTTEIFYTSSATLIDTTMHFSKVFPLIKISNENRRQWTPIDHRKKEAWAVTLTASSVQNVEQSRWPFNPRGEAISWYWFSSEKQGHCARASWKRRPEMGGKIQNTWSIDVITFIGRPMESRTTEGGRIDDLLQVSFIWKLKAKIWDSWIYLKRSPKANSRN